MLTNPQILIAETFGQDFSRPGSMYRGEVPRGQLHPMSSDFQNGLLLARKWRVTVSNLKLEPQREKRTQKGLKKLFSDGTDDLHLVMLYQVTYY